MEGSGKSDKIKLLNQGSYGCVYRPGFKCNQKIQNKKYITKIQSHDDNSKRETEIGNLIKSIKNYDLYFAPVINSCKVSVGNIQEDEIKKCNILNENQKTYMTNKIKYVGKYTLADYLTLLYEKKPKLFLRVFLESFLQLLNNVDILQKNHILHMDLKENNIMYDEKNENPIIIDFGLSFNINKLSKENYKELFFVYGFDYPPWCFDISILSFMVNELGELWYDVIVTDENLFKVCDNFILKNPLFILDEKNIMFSQIEIEDYRKKLLIFVDQFKGKKWIDVFDECLRYNHTWDSYAIHVIFLFLVNDLQLYELYDQFPFLKNFILHLKTTILSLPNERKNALESISIVKNIFQNTLSDDVHNIMNVIHLESLKNEKVEKKKKNVAQTKLNELKKEALFYNNM